MRLESHCILYLLTCSFPFQPAPVELPSFLLTIERSESFLSLGHLGERGAMPGKPAGLVQGTLDMLILKTLALDFIAGTVALFVVQRVVNKLRAE